MATLATVVNKDRPRSDGTFRVFIRVTHNRVNKYIPTDYYVKKTQLNNNGKIIDNYVIIAVDRILTELRKRLTLINNIEDFDINNLVNFLTREKDEDIDFITFGQERVKMLKTSGQMKTSVIYQTAINSIKDYHGQTTLPFKQFNAKFLSNYEKWLLNKKIGKTERVVGATTVNSYMRTIRAIFNAARVEYNNEDIDDVRIKNYPFRKYKIKEAPLSATKELDAKTIRKIRDSKWKRKLDNQARDMFMISFYLVGINTIDLYNLLKPVNDIITYNRAKTDSRRNDKAEMQIRVEPELKQIIEQYQGLDDKCFNIFQQYSNHEGFTRAFNNGLKRIGKELQLPRKLTTYFVRDSWATIASNDCEVLDDHIEMALNHSIQKKKLTLGYIKKDFSKVWKANRKVIDFLNKKEEEESVPVS